MPSATLPPPSAAMTSLLRSSNPELRRIEVRESADSVELNGLVSSFYLKQLAQETVRSSAAGRRILNRVRVCR